MPVVPKGPVVWVIAKGRLAAVARKSDFHLAVFDNGFCVYNNELLRSLENPHPIGDDLPRYCEASHC
jgi:hypothetical protein